MKLKSVMAGLLCTAVCMSMAACASTEKTAESAQESKRSTADTAEVKGPVMHRLTIRAPKDMKEMTATFLNTSNGKTAVANNQEITAGIARAIGRDQEADGEAEGS